MLRGHMFFLCRFMRPEEMAKKQAQRPRREHIYNDGRITDEVVEIPPSKNPFIGVLGGGKYLSPSGYGSAFGLTLVESSGHKGLTEPMVYETAEQALMDREGIFSPPIVIDYPIPVNEVAWRVVVHCDSSSYDVVRDCGWRKARLHYLAILGLSISDGTIWPTIHSRLSSFVPSVPEGLRVEDCLEYPGKDQENYERRNTRMDGVSIRRAQQLALDLSLPHWDK